MVNDLPSHVMHYKHISVSDLTSHVLIKIKKKALLVMYSTYGIVKGRDKEP